MSKRVLVAPLNWGLGHASRMIPVIREFVRQGAEVIIAADGRPYELLKSEFPMLKRLRFPGYDITYQSTGNFAMGIFRQLPKIIRSYLNEGSALETLIRSEQIDIVISDNRYGMHSTHALCIFVTHQIAIRMPNGLRWFEPLLFQQSKSIINRYHACWIPDVAGEKNLSGELTRKYGLPRNTTFVGPLTRMKKKESEKKIDLLLLLSGPEPQRTLFEELLREQAMSVGGKVVMVRGVFEGLKPKRINERFTQVDYMNSEELNETILASNLVICRPGYSTVLDLAALGSKAVFVPTPGQTEQEYLADYFSRQGVAYSERQENFSLLRALAQSAAYSGFTENYGSSPLEAMVAQLLQANADGVELLPRPTNVIAAN